MALKIPRWARLDYGGVVLGLAGAALSVTPSLVPRPAVLQGALVGVAFGVGYAFGALVFWLLRRFVPWRPDARGMRIAWLALGAVVVVTVVVMAFLAVAWQNGVRRLVEMPALDGVDGLGFTIAALVVVVIALGIGRVVKRVFRALSRLAQRLLGGRQAKDAARPRRAALTPIAAVVVTAVLIVAVGAGIGGIGMLAIDGVYAGRNDTVQADIPQPDSTYRSTGADSLVDWSKLGRQGRAFVGGGPTADEIEKVTGEPAKTPIRVYVGSEQASTLTARASLAVRELQRTGAFDRKVLVVATSTGSGWLEPQATDAVEFLQGGDTAIVSMQYAYTPSWVSFLFDQDLPVAASVALFDAVHEAWAKLPADHRPKLVAYGLSLGAHGMQSVFPDLAAVRSETDGALFVGSPNGTPLWNALQDSRDAGSPPWQPVLGNGAEVRWASKNGDLERLPGAWTRPRVVYLQHATDPVTWLSPTLLWSAPDWLRPGNRGTDVSPQMTWIPVVTGLQVLIDMLMGESVPASHGHNYGDVMVGAWDAIVPSQLDAAAVRRVQHVIEGYAADSPITE